MHRIVRGSAWQNWLARRQGGLWRRRVDPRPVTTTSCDEMNAQNSSRVSATSCGTIQATASRLAGVARLAAFLILEKRALPFRQGRNLRSAPLGEAAARFETIQATARWRTATARLSHFLNQPFGKNSVLGD